MELLSVLIITAQFGGETKIADTTAANSALVDDGQFSIQP